MAMEIKVSKTVQIRRLHATGLDADDIIKVTGWPQSIVRQALAVRRPIKK